MREYESVYECVYSSEAVVRTAHVRAWDVAEAADLFAHELRGDGVEERGEIRARALDGKDVHTSIYAGFQ